MTLTRKNLKELADAIPVMAIDICSDQIEVRTSEALQQSKRKELKCHGWVEPSVTVRTIQV